MKTNYTNEKFIIKIFILVVFTCGFHADMMAVIIENPLLELKN